MGRIKRSAERFIKRMEVEFSAGDKTYKGFVSNISATGLFIRTSHSYREGLNIDIRIFLPDGRTSVVKGVVRRAIATLDTRLSKNGMGIELTQKDENFINFLKEIGGDEAVKAEHATPGPVTLEPATPEPEVREVEFLMITCSGCGANNRVPSDKLSLGPKCGRCKEPLPTG